MSKLNDGSAPISQNEFQALHSEFMFYLGICISSWSTIDAWLFRIFKKCIGGTNRRAAFLFYKSPQISDHIRLVDIVVDDLINQQKVNPKEFAREWKCTCKSLKCLIEFRNHIAHNPIIWQGNDDDFYWNYDQFQSVLLGEIPNLAEEIRFRIVTEQYKLNKREKDHSGRYKTNSKDVAYIEDLKSHFKQVGVLQGQLVHFFAAIYNHCEGKPLELIVQHVAEDKHK